MGDDESNERSGLSSMTEEEWKRRSDLGLKSKGTGYITEFLIRRKRRRMTVDADEEADG